MRYFQIYADDRSPGFQFLDWYRVLKPVKWQDREVYDALKNKSHFKVELNKEIEFPDVICHPLFMVSKDFAHLTRLYDPTIRFKMAYLFDEKSKRSALYQIPRLPEINCLSDESKLNTDKSVIVNGVLSNDLIEPYPIFKLGGVNGRIILANLEFVESAYRRKVIGMKIREFVVR